MVTITPLPGLIRYEVKDLDRDVVDGRGFGGGAAIKDGSGFLGQRGDASTIGYPCQRHRI